jgi:hypothetical protein
MLLMAWGTVLPSGKAHVLDEYLQATLVAIEPGEIRLHINLTPGVEIADKVLPLIDRDRSGQLSPDEAAAYGELFQRDVVARLDGRKVELNLAASKVPELAELRTGHGFMQLEFSLSPGEFAAGSHELSIENRHLPAIAAYLFNAAKPKSGLVQITKQRRNDNQSVGGIEFTFRPPVSSYQMAGRLAFLAVLFGAVLAGAWRMRKSRAHST